MVTNLIQDDGPTTTINFQTFEEITEAIVADNFNPIAYPEGREVVHLLQWFNILTIFFRLADDASFPSSGDSAADKWADLKDLVLGGGDNDGLFTLIFDSEDSTVATPQTESYQGRIKNLQKTSIAGEKKKILGNFEFWIQDLG